MRITQKALTFDDVLLVPAYSNILPRDASMKTQLSRNIFLNIPLVSAAMDTVTESRLAIALAQEGGIGIVHKNLSAKAQAFHAWAQTRVRRGVFPYAKRLGGRPGATHGRQLTYEGLVVGPGSVGGSEGGSAGAVEGVGGAWARMITMVVSRVSSGAQSRP